MPVTSSRPENHLRAACEADASFICDIYNPYVLESRVTFEEVAVTPGEMRRRMGAHGTAFPWLVIESGGVLEAFAYATPWKPRAAYRHSVECSVYVASRAQRRGHGRRLYGELVQRLRSTGMRTAIAGIALPNEASVALHESLGFAKVAHFERIGHKLGRWVDVGYWQLQL
jgi:phosphinothricin acetyltransferase